MTTILLYSKLLTNIFIKIIKIRFTQKDDVSLFISLGFCLPGDFNGNLNQQGQDDAETRNDSIEVTLAEKIASLLEG